MTVGTASRPAEEQAIGVFGCSGQHTVGTARRGRGNGRGPQLLLGQLLRGARSDATAVLRHALAVFEELGTSLWAERARAELADTTPRARTPQRLTPAEQRVGELAATGMKNRDVAATLFISGKTVEATLARSTASWESGHARSSGGT
jgi:Bacterial regulatory proteins, luxR family